MEVIEFKNVVWDMTRRISECMDGMFRPISEQYGLTHMQMRILMELWSAEDSPTIGQLGRTLGMTSGNMSSMCKRLEQEGFLLRVRIYRMNVWSKSPYLRRGGHCPGD